MLSIERHRETKLCNDGLRTRPVATARPSAGVFRKVEALTLIRSRRSSVVLLTLLALLLAQAAAGLHLLRHLGAGRDSAGPPGQHSPVCQECASFAPLAGTHGGPAGVLTVAAAGPVGLRSSFQDQQHGHRLEASYQSRAPPI